MDLLIFQNSYKFFQFFFTFTKTLLMKKNQRYNRATISSVTRNIIVCYMECCHEITSEIHNVTFIFQNSKKIKNVKTIEKIPMNSEKSINSCKIKIVGNLIIHRTVFSNLLITSRPYYYAKYVNNIFNMVDFFSDSRLLLRVYL